MFPTNWYYDFDGDGQAFPKFPKQQVCNVFTISQKEVRDEVDFLYADKQQSFLQVGFSTLHQSLLQGNSIIFDGCD